MAVARLLHCFGKFCAGCDGAACNAMRVGELYKVGTDERRGFVVAFVEEFLPLAHHAEVAVIDDGDVDLELFLDDGRELGGGHLEAAIAGDHPHFFFGQAIFAPIAAGSANPIVPRPPDVTSERGFS